MLKDLNQNPSPIPAHKQRKVRALRKPRPEGGAPDGASDTTNLNSGPSVVDRMRAWEENKKKRSE